MPLQKAELGVGGGLVELERGEHCGLLLRDGGDAGNRRGVVDADGVMLDASQLAQCRLGAEFVSVVSKLDGPMFKYDDGRRASSADVVDDDADASGCR